MRKLSVEQQVAALRPAVVVGFAGNMHKWFLAGAALGMIMAILFWHPVPLVIAAFLGFIGFSEQRAGPNIVAALAAYDFDTPTYGEVFIAITSWDTDNFYDAKVCEQGYSDWKFEFIPQGWQPATSSYRARIWRNGSEGQPILVAVDDGLLIPRYTPKKIANTTYQEDKQHDHGNHT
jgi:hypothetical protein